jgi:hypothetical protein
MDNSKLAEKFLAASEFKAVCKIDYHALEGIINEYFLGEEYPKGHEGFEFVAVEECGNDSDHSFNVKKNDVSEYDLETIENAKKGEFDNYSTSTILNHLCDEGIIPECELIVNVCW